MNNPDAKSALHSAYLHALRLGSPALPVGAFSYSQGLEYAVECDWVNNAESLFAWTSGILRHALLYVDIPVIRRCYHAWQEQDNELLQHWNDQLLAFRETQELYDEDINVGAAMHRHLQNLDLKELTDQISPPYSYVTLFALAGSHWKIPVDQLCLTFSWSWAENQVAAAIKLFPLGQTKGQQVLCDLIPVIDVICVNSEKIADHEIGGSCYGLSIASMKHETQYSRLFRS